ncbi:hypothetical protein EV13_2755 [Prochlorococcus sp. MIT 0702]|nr:hypothetical protein EV12_2705 [Prochlorococcus sp. MIT 0701]KGG25981.1 hypothetical protein EV13_2755 [Prochlorococcus sp. MIT 0702]KGG30841.1 hypothetical protein EV14_2780 [Prochlorococcus sp. MIT 0703]
MQAGIVMVNHDNKFLGYRRLACEAHQQTDDLSRNDILA